jgi:serine/threonine protein kinase
VVVIAKEIAGRYRSRRKLGAGGMGTVYKGLDMQTVLLIAIKQLKPEMASPEITHTITANHLSEPKSVLIPDRVPD